MTLPEVMPHTVLLDWDGTLVDSYNFLKDAHNHAREQHGYEAWDDAAFQRVMRQSTREAFAGLYGDRAGEVRGSLFAYVDEHHGESLVLMDGAVELLEFLSGAGIRIGIVSNKKHERLAGDVVELGWDRYVGTVVGAGAAERDKPAADPAFMALRQLNVTDIEPAGVWFVGDTATDLECAGAAGVSGVLTLHGVGGPELVELYRPSYVFDDLKALVAAMEKRSCQCCKSRLGSR